MKRKRLVGKIKDIKRLEKKYKKPKLLGFDTETVNGKIYSMQFYGENVDEFKLVWGWTEKEILDYIYDKYKGYHLYAHNLSFDLGVILGEMILDHDKRFHWHNYFCNVIYPHPCYATFSKNKRGVLRFADTVPFFKMSLKKAAEFIGYKKKLERPDYLGERKPKKNEMEYFIKYAMMDAEICYELALKIAVLHEEFDVPINYTVSIASLSAKIFRKYFIEYPIPKQPTKIMNMALESYHGGRTEAFGFGHVKDVTFYDINSSYPYSMSNIKIPIGTEWKRTTILSEDGFYNISCFIPKKKITPLPYDKNGLLQFPCGYFKRITVTGIEAIEIKKVSSQFKVNEGYVYYGKYTRYMKDFVDCFFTKKKEAKSKVDYMFFKLIMNSLYGKTIQMNSDKMNIGGYISGKGFIKNEEVKRPSGLFNPVIASWITAMSRIVLYRKMDAYEPYVLYCDTDSIATTRKCPKLESSKELGLFQLEKTGSDFFVIREKFYMLKDKKIIKTGRHAFRGDENLFLECLNSKNSKQIIYKVRRMTQLRESKIRKVDPFVMELRPFVFNINPSKKRTSAKFIGWHPDFMKKFYWIKPFFVFE